MMSLHSRAQNVWDNLPWLYLFLGVVAVALMVGGYYTHEASMHGVEGTPLHKLGVVSHILTEFAIAILVAIFLALTLERISKREFHRLAEEQRQASKENVFHYVYGQSLPKEAMIEIEHQLLKHPFVKHRVELRHDLKPYDADSKYVLLTTSIEYEVENVTEEEKEYNVSLMSDDAPDPQFETDCCFLSLSYRCGAERKDLTQQDLAAKTSKDILSHISNNSLAVKIPAKGRASFVAMMQCVKRLEYDLDVFASNDLICGGLIFDVTVDQRLPLDVEAHAFHRTKITHDTGSSAAHRRFRWAVREPVLRHQGGFVMWKKKAPPKAEPAPKTDAKAIDGKVQSGTAAPPPRETEAPRSETEPAAGCDHKTKPAASVTAPAS